MGVGFVIVAARVHVTEILRLTVYLAASDTELTEFTNIFQMIKFYLSSLPTVVSL
jgi:hypothetical protein